ncbi:hypothetical protein BGX29_012053 [Mortierella sp. GBA35]|nr:hypothetical protein BGX29_012053 [Mortierella sp. GBA35]
MVTSILVHAARLKPDFGERRIRQQIPSCSARLLAQCNHLSTVGGDDPSSGIADDESDSDSGHDDDWRNGECDDGDGNDGDGDRNKNELYPFRGWHHHPSLAFCRRAYTRCVFPPIRTVLFEALEDLPSLQLFIWTGSYFSRSSEVPAVEPEEDMWRL